MKHLHPSKSYDKSLLFPETTSTAIALQNFSTRNLQSDTHLRHSMLMSQDIVISDIPCRVKTVVPTVNFPGGHVCCRESDWCYLRKDFTSCFWLKQIIKALVFSKLWFSKHFFGENSKNSGVQHTQFDPHFVVPPVTRLPLWSMACQA